MNLKNLFGQLRLNVSEFPKKTTTCVSDWNFRVFCVKIEVYQAFPMVLFRQQIDQFKSKISELFATITNNMRFRLHFQVFLFELQFHSGIVDFHFSNI